MSGQSVFYEQFSLWKKAMEKCIALKQSPVLCLCQYTGQPCAFVNCPRRLFESELKVEGALSLESQLLKHEERLKSLEDKLDSIKAILDAAIKKVETKTESTARDSTMYG